MTSLSSHATSGPSAIPHRRRLITFIAGAIVLWVAGLISHGHPGAEGDAAHYLIITHSIAFDGDLDVSNDYGMGTRLVFEGGLDAGLHARESRGGLRPVHDIGLPLVAAPLFRPTYVAAEWLAGVLPREFMQRARLTPSIVLRHFISLQMSVVAAVLGICLFSSFVRLNPGSDRAAAAAAVLFVVSPPIVPFSFSFFTELPAALAAFAAYRAIRAHERPRAVVAAAVGCLCGLLILLHIRNVGIAAALFALAAFRWRRERAAVVALAAGAGLLIFVRTMATYQMWGTWISTPHAKTGTAADAVTSAGFAEAAVRLGGLLFDREHGLLPFAPLYLLAPAGWYLLFRRDRRHALELLFLVGCCLLPILTPINPYGWRGGWSPAARFLVPIIPFVAVMAWAALTTVRPAVMWLIAGGQMILNGLFWSQPKLLWEDGDGVSKLFTLISADTGLFAHVPPGLGENVSASLTATAIGVFAWAVLSLLLVRISRPLVRSAHS